MLNRKIDGESIVYDDGTTVVLTIGEKSADQGIILSLNGQLRSELAHDIQDELVALATVGANIVVDFEKVTYISPTTQHIFLRVQQKMDTMGKGTLLLRKLPKEIFLEFEKTGASELLMIEA